MHKKVIQLAMIMAIFISQNLQAQYTKSDSYKKWFVGSTMFLLGNLDKVNPPSFAQVNIGYRITPKDVVSLEPKTWKYSWPNGIHLFLNDAYGKNEEKFPGSVREIGMSFVYQRFLHKGIYAVLNVNPQYQNILNERNYSGHKVKELYLNMVTND
jgi:hypothetical protein